MANRFVLRRAARIGAGSGHAETQKENVTQLSCPKNRRDLRTVTDGDDATGNLSFASSASKFRSHTLQGVIRNPVQALAPRFEGLTKIL